MKKYITKMIIVLIIAIISNICVILFPVRETFHASELPSVLASGSDRKVADESSGVGILTYGPYIRLPSGKSEITIKYSADVQGNTAMPYSQTVQEICTPYSLSPDQNELTFIVDADNDIKDFEIQVIYSGKGTLEVYEVSITSRRQDLIFILALYDVIFAGLIVLFAVLAAKNGRDKDSNS